MVLYRKEKNETCCTIINIEWDDNRDRSLLQNNRICYHRLSQTLTWALALLWYLPDSLWWCWSSEEKDPCWWIDLPCCWTPLTLVQLPQRAAQQERSTYKKWRNSKMLKRPKVINYIEGHTCFCHKSFFKSSAVDQSLRSILPSLSYKRSYLQLNWAGTWEYHVSRLHPAVSSETESLYHDCEQMQPYMHQLAQYLKLCFWKDLEGKLWARRVIELDSLPWRGQFLQFQQQSSNICHSQRLWRLPAQCILPYPPPFVLSSPLWSAHTVT